jgi:hypothetical protein
VQDAAAATAVYDYVMEVAPAAYGRVPEFLLDNRLYNLVARYLLDNTSREKTELHFFRSFLAALGETFVHLDRDIKCEAWGGFDVSLRDALDQLLVATGTAVKTIEGITPDGSGNFDMVPGTGISLTPQPNGLMVSATSSSGPIDVLKSEMAVAPGGSLTLNLTTTDFLAQMWLKVNGVYHKSGNVPDMAGKHLDLDFNLGVLASPNTPRIATAVGTAGGRPGVHVAGRFVVGEFNIARFDGLTMDLEETYTLSVDPSAPNYEPVVTCGRDTLGQQKVVVCWVESQAGLMTLMYAELDPANYANAPLIFSVNSMIGPPGVQAWPHPQDGVGNVARLFATLDAFGNLFVSANTDITGIVYPTLIQIRVGAGVPNAVVSPVIFASSYTALDLVADHFNSKIYWLVAARELVPAGGTMDLYQVTSAFPAPPVMAGPLVVDNTAPHGFNYKQGGLSINPSVNEVGVTYVVERLTAALSATENRLEHIRLSNLAGAFPPAGAVITPVSLGRDWTVALPFQARFGRWWNSGGVDAWRAFSYFVEPCMSEDRWVAKRQVFDTTGPEQDSEIWLNLLKLDAWGSRPPAVDESYLWTRPANTNSMLVDPYAYFPRVLISLDTEHCFAALDGSSFGENLTLEFDPITMILTGKNNSAFMWDLKLRYPTRRTSWWRAGSSPRLFETTSSTIVTIPRPPATRRAPAASRVLFGTRMRPEASSQAAWPSIRPTTRWFRGPGTSLEAPLRRRSTTP